MQTTTPEKRAQIVPLLLEYLSTRLIETGPTNFVQITTIAIGTKHTSYASRIRVPIRTSLAFYGIDSHTVTRREGFFFKGVTGNPEL